MANSKPIINYLPYTDSDGKGSVYLINNKLSGGVKENRFIEEDFCSPLILDLNHDGKLSTNINKTSVYFDMDNDSFKEKTAWVNKEDGLLVRDLNSNNIIDNGSELFENFKGSEVIDTDKGTITIDGILFASIENISTMGDDILDGTNSNITTVNNIFYKNYQRIA